MSTELHETTAGATAGVIKLRWLLARQVRAHGGLVESVGLTLLDLDRPARAVSQACAKTVAEAVGNEARLAVYDREGTLVTRGDALATAVAQLLVDDHHISQHAAPRAPE